MVELVEVEYGGVWNLGNFENLRLTVRAKAKNVGDLVELVEKLARCFTVLRRLQNRMYGLDLGIARTQSEIASLAREIGAIEREFTSKNIDLEKVDVKDLVAFSEEEKRKYRTYLEHKKNTTDLSIKEAELREEKRNLYMKYEKLKKLLNDGKVNEALNYIHKELTDFLQTTPYDP